MSWAKISKNMKSVKHRNWISIENKVSGFSWLEVAERRMWIDVAHLHEGLESSVRQTRISLLCEWILGRWEGIGKHICISMGLSNACMDSDDLCERQEHWKPPGTEKVGAELEYWNEETWSVEGSDEFKVGHKSSLTSGFLEGEWQGVFLSKEVRDHKGMWMSPTHPLVITSLFPVR